MTGPAVTYRLPVGSCLESNTSTGAMSSYSDQGRESLDGYHRWYQPVELVLFGGFLGVTAALLLVEVLRSVLNGPGAVADKMTFLTILAVGYFVPPIFLAFSFDTRRKGWARFGTVIFVYLIVYGWTSVVSTQIDGFPPGLSTELHGGQVGSLVLAVAATNFLWPVAHKLLRVLGRSKT